MLLAISLSTRSTWWGLKPVIPYNDDYIGIVCAVKGAVLCYNSRLGTLPGVPHCLTLPVQAGATFTKLSNGIIGIRAWVGNNIPLLYMDVIIHPSTKFRDE